jgi:sporulation related protein
MSLDTHPILDVERRLGGAGPFVINLHASTAPIGLPSKSPAGNEHARLYQIQRVDDGRIRYRLRLGPFATEDEAEVALAQARLEYPGALMLTAAADDLHAIARFTLPITADPVVPAALPAAAAPEPPLVLTLVEDAPVRAAAPVPPLILTLVEDAPVRAAAAAVPKPTPTPAAMIAAPAAAAAAPVRAPAPVAAVAAPQRAAVSVVSDIASMQALIAAIDTDIDTSRNKVTTKPPVLHTVPAAKVTARRDVARAGTPAPSLESTQTLRPLTPLELGANEAARWFVVQLALSDDAFDPDALPHLDIFSLYRLYTVIGLDQGRLAHALRLGFFGEEAGVL